jgi:hypothetical protein
MDEYQEILEELQRQAGLTGRHLASGTLGLGAAFANPIAATANKGLEMFGSDYRFPDQYEAAQDFMSEMGVPEPENPIEKGVGFFAELGVPDPTDAAKVTSGIQHLFADPEMAGLILGAFGVKPGSGIHTLGDSSITPTQMDTISTRVPTPPQQKLQGINPHTRNDMLVDYRHYNPEELGKAVDLFRNLPGFQNLSPDPNEAFETVVNRMTDNLNFVMERMPTKWRNKAKDWYLGYNRIGIDAAKKHNTSPEQSTAVIAALSPQTEWNMNITRADRIMDAMNRKQDQQWTAEMDYALGEVKKSLSGKRPAKTQNGEKYIDLLPRVKGKKLKDLTDPAEKAVWIRAYDMAHNPRTYPTYEPTGSQSGQAKLGDKKTLATANWASMGPIEKAVRILEDGSMQNISKQLGEGHKVRSFFRNAADPWEKTTATMDTHAVATALLTPYGASSTIKLPGGGSMTSPVANNFGTGVASPSAGQRGTYPIYQEAYNRAADNAGLGQARQAQSPTWDYGRLMFENKKAAHRQHQAGKIWDLVGAGELTEQQAREMILQSFGAPKSPY